MPTTHISIFRQARASALTLTSTQRGSHHTKDVRLTGAEHFLLQKLEDTHEGILRGMFHHLNLVEDQLDGILRNLFLVPDVQNENVLLTMLNLATNDEERDEEVDTL